MTYADQPDGRNGDDVIAGRGRAAGPECDGMAGHLELASSGRRVPVIMARDVPTASALVGEDACWQFARLFWRDRRPARWRISRHRVWRTEERELEQKRQRLVAMSEEVLGPR